jgi:hypothetical protein
VDVVEGQVGDCLGQVGPEERQQRVSVLLTKVVQGGRQGVRGHVDAVRNDLAGVGKGPAEAVKLTEQQLRLELGEATELVEHFSHNRGLVLEERFLVQQHGG